MPRTRAAVSATLQHVEEVVTAKQYSGSMTGNNHNSKVIFLNSDNHSKQKQQSTSSTGNGNDRKQQQ